MAKNVKRSVTLNRAEGTTTPARDKKKEVKQTNYTLWIVAAVALIIGVYLYIKKRK